MASCDLSSVLCVPHVPPAPSVLCVPLVPPGPLWPMCTPCAPRPLFCPMGNRYPWCASCLWILCVPLGLVPPCPALVSYVYPWCPLAPHLCTMCTPGAPCPSPVSYVYPWCPLAPHLCPMCTPGALLSPCDPLLSN